MLEILLDRNARAVHHQRVGFRIEDVIAHQKSTGVLDIESGPDVQPVHFHFRAVVLGAHEYSQSG